MKNWFKNALVVVATFLLCLIGAEVIMRLFSLDQTLRYVNDKELYWTFQPNQYGYIWMGQGSFKSPDIRINNVGFRGQDIDTSRATTPRILILGDSYAFGAGVGEEETLAAVIKKHLAAQQPEVINAGVPGYGIFQTAVLLKRWIPILRPDVVVLIFPIGDILRQPFATKQEEEQFLSQQEKRKKLRDISKFLTFVYRKMYYLYLRHSQAKAVPNEKKQVNRGIKQLNDLWQKDLKRIREMAILCERSGAHFLILVWPQKQFAAVEQTIIEDLQSLASVSNKITVLSELKSYFQPYPEETLIIQGDGHPSPLAYQIAGRYIAENIPQMRKDVLPQ